MKRTALLAVAAVAALGLSACSSGTGGSGGSSSASTQLNIYAWADEIPKTVIAAFEKETGIKVTVDTFDANETMISKLAAGGAGYDIVEPSQYAVQQLVGQNLVEKLDHSKITGLDNLGKKFADPSYDPGNEYSIPWIWGTTGLAYNEKCTGTAIDSWDALWDPAYKGKIYMLDNMLSAYIPALQVNGLKATSTSEKDIEKATQSLLDQKPLLAGYNSSNYADLLASGDACVAEAYGGSAIAKVTAANPDVKFVIPKEGGTLWVDGFAVAKDAPHADAAYKWLNFTLRPEIAAMATNDGGSATANDAAKADITDTTMLESVAVYPTDEQLKNSEFIVDPGKALQYFQQGWTKVKAS
ncbi:spermidine/putrescine ABC transporter substrate-binding protein [Leifsonia sp. ZF2019]|uniref:ABC transporter substrate-binding protein n=1 Tax=Leifsonia sp. ZF2019 TaxID=2781978 RepID=UPI001CC05D1D|nr:spermidine/putrescine ABC transporter substrate-binding protein [Leifsonia sp. ZF2019]UAJ80265.1 spermidine/putrescine ABC transporter substrate-binding protein [Leifsonia sp. ZF2019]